MLPNVLFNSVIKAINQSSSLAVSRGEQSTVFPPFHVSTETGVSKVVVHGSNDAVPMEERVFVFERRIGVYSPI